MGRKTHCRRMRRARTNVDANGSISDFQPPTDDVIHTLDDLFSRRYDYTFDSTWQLPSSEKFFRDDTSAWQDDELMSMKSHLNDVKSRLSSVDIVTWQTHTQAMHPGSLVARSIQRTRCAEMCTQAWCKFHEVLGTFPAIAQLSSTRELNSVHLCEAPGAFVTSLNHFLASRESKSYQWRWLASTLNPYYEGNSLQSMIQDDSLIAETSNHWFFGADNTGDVFSPGFIESAANECIKKQLNSVHLVTADGSVDCANDPGQQEVKVASLIYAEAITALSLLCRGGNLVLKMFTLFEQSSVCLMYLLCCLFEQVHLLKPATSKSGNSEVYIIAECFKTLDDHCLTVLKRHMGDSNYPMLSIDDIPPSFLEQHRLCCRRLMNWQASTILSNIASFQVPLDSGATNRLQQLKRNLTIGYVGRFCLHPIDHSQHVVPNPHNQNVTNYERQQTSEIAVPVKRRYTGALVDRQSLLATPWKLRVLQMEAVEIDDIPALSQFKCSFQMLDTEICHWSVECGKALTEICSSPFCSKTLLATYRDFLQNVQCDHQQPTKSAVLSHLAKCPMLCYTVGHNDVTTVCILGSGNSDIAAQLRNSMDGLNVNVVEVADGQSVATGALVIGCNILDCVSSSDVDCAISVAPLMDFVSLMQVVKEDCSCIIAVGALLTRRTVGVLYILCCCFSQVSVYKDSSLPVLFLCAMKLHHLPASLLQHIINVGRHLSTSSQHQMLSFVPMSSLCDASFYGNLRQLNDDYLKLRIHRLQCLVKDTWTE